MKSNTRILLAPAALLLAGIVIHAQTPAKVPEGSGEAPPAGLPGALPAARDGSSGSITLHAAPAGPGGAPVPGIGATPPLTITGSASVEELPAPGTGGPPPQPLTPVPAPPLPPPTDAPRAILNGSGTIELRPGGMRPPPIQGEWIVRPGDTLTSIGRQTGVPADTLLRLNGLTETTLRAGQKLKTTEARIMESPATILHPRSGQDIIRETKLKVLQRHYESALSDTMEMERSLITAPADQQEELSGKAKALREFVTKLEGDIEKLGGPAHRNITGETRVLRVPGGAGDGAAFPGRHPDARPVDPTDVFPPHDPNLPPQPPQPAPRVR